MAEGSYCPLPNLAHRTLRDFPPFTSHTKVFHLKSTNSPYTRTQSKSYYRDASRNFHHASSPFNRLSCTCYNSHHIIVVVVPRPTTAHSNFSQSFVENNHERLPQLGHGASNGLGDVVSPSIVRSYVERNAMCVPSPIPNTLQRHAISCKKGRDGTSLSLGETRNLSSTGVQGGSHSSKKISVNTRNRFWLDR